MTYIFSYKLIFAISYKIQLMTMVKLSYLMTTRLLDIQVRVSAPHWVKMRKLSNI